MASVRCLLRPVYSIFKDPIVRKLSTSTEGTVKLAYASYQSTNNLSGLPPLVIIHGLFGSKRNWDSLSKAISRKGIKVVAVDCRNHGESPHTTHMSFPAMADDVEALMGELKIPEAVILGHSMGGKVAMSLALSKPHLVSRLIVEDVSPNYSREVIASNIPGYIEAMRAVVFDNDLPMSQLRDDVSAQLESTIPHPGVRAFILTNLVNGDEGYRWQVNLDAIGTHLVDITKFPHYDTQYTGDTLFVGGSLSPYIQKANHPEIHRLFPNVNIQYVEGAGHWVHSEKPNEFLKIIMEFLNEQS